jgi:catechol 2,3-dioxygenase-like lactoylglutathione lyase family enzyme
MKSISERITGIHHMTMPVGDLELAEKFYSEVFGAEVTPRLSNHISVVIGIGPRLDLFLQDEIQPATKDLHPHIGWDLTPEELAECAEILDEHGVGYDGPTHAGRTGTANIYFDDPWGNHHELQCQDYPEGAPVKERDRSRMKYQWPPKK